MPFSGWCIDFPFSGKKRNSTIQGKTSPLCVGGVSGTPTFFCGPLLGLQTSRLGFPSNFFGYLSNGLQVVLFFLLLLTKDALFAVFCGAILTTFSQFAHTLGTTGLICCRDPHRSVRILETKITPIMHFLKNKGCFVFFLFFYLWRQFALFVYFSIAVSI